ncbi:MAG TPA: cytochrome P460 family protein [Burkholderiaceae bacterium]
MKHADVDHITRDACSSSRHLKRLSSRWTGFATVAGAVAVSCAFAVTSAASEDAHEPAASSLASPIYGVTIPKGYRTWEFIAPALESEPLNELRAVLGNVKAVQAYTTGRLPFPDGTILVKLAWKHVKSPEFDPALVPGEATTVQIMVKDSKKYAATGGWGFGRFVDGRPADLAQHQTCFACHASKVKERDYVFTKFVP